MLIATLPLGKREQVITVNELVYKIPSTQFDVEYWDTTCWQNRFWSILDILVNMAINTPEKNTDLCPS